MDALPFGWFGGEQGTAVNTAKCGRSSTTRPSKSTTLFPRDTRDRPLRITSPRVAITAIRTRARTLLAETGSRACSRPCSTFAAKNGRGISVGKGPISWVALRAAALLSPTSGSTVLAVLHSASSSSREDYFLQSNDLWGSRRTVG